MRLILAFFSSMFTSSRKHHSDSNKTTPNNKRIGHCKNGGDKVVKIGVLNGVLLQEFLWGVEPSERPKLCCHCLCRARERLLQGMNAPTSGQWYALWKWIHHDSSRFIQYKSIRLYTSRACGLMLPSTRMHPRIGYAPLADQPVRGKRLLHEAAHRHFARPGCR